MCALVPSPARPESVNVQAETAGQRQYALLASFRRLVFAGDVVGLDRLTPAGRRPSSKGTSATTLAYRTPLGGMGHDEPGPQRGAR